jgi:GAF domain-containing protein
MAAAHAAMPLCRSTAAAATERALGRCTDRLGDGRAVPRLVLLAPGPATPIATLAPVDADFMERTVARLGQEESTFDWVGVYLLEGDGLVLGPYRGTPTEHDRIPLGQGVCGSVAATGQTEVVPDVRARPGHIACDVRTRSEVVVPIKKDGKVLGVLDVDSNELDAFGEREVALIEQAAREIAARP